MTDETTQQTLTGDEADCGRYRPQTFVRCYGCGSWILRSRRREHGRVNTNPRWDSQFMEPREKTLAGGDE